MNNVAIGKWLMYIGILMFAAGLSFFIIEELDPYVMIGIILMIIGVACNLISVVYKKRSRG